MNQIVEPLPSLSKVAGRGFVGRCPNCGQSRLFARYLKQVDHCAICQEAYGHIRADDGPAWLTIVLVGHIVIPLAVIVTPRVDWPDWQMMIIWVSMVIVLTLLFLPRAKGLFIGVIWRTGCVGSEK